MTRQTADQQSVVFVVDDDVAIREGLTALFESVGLEVRVFASASEFLKIKFPNCPSCLVLDVRLPGMSGLDFQSELAKANIQIPTIFMTGHGDIPMSVRAMKAGAVEFLTKPFRDQEMLDAVQLAHEQDRRRRENEGSSFKLKSSFAKLTPREKEIVELVVKGLMNKQIAGELGVSEITVKVHRGSAMRKLGAKSLVELVQMAEVLGIRATKT
jgi:FixJ family two-component response regulator